MMTEKRDNTLRLFFALCLSEAERTSLAKWQPPLFKLCGGQVVFTEALHATLVFLGNVPAHRLEALQLAAQEVSGNSFELPLNEAHYWKHNHIVYAAPSSVPLQLVRLVHKLEQSLLVHKFAFDHRLYKPHITLLRHAQWTDAPLPKMPDVILQARNFSLVQSLHDKQACRYQSLATFPLR